MKLRLSSKCPLCGSPHEDQNHILTCSNPSLDSLRSDLLSKILSWMKSTKTNPHLIIFIYNGLHTWFQNSTQHHHFSLPSTTSQIITTGIFSQHSIGWFNTLCGYLTNEFIDIQTSHYLSINSRQSGTTWAATLISKFWNLLQTLWTYRNIQ